VDGPLESVTLCHCVECRRWHGHVCAMTAAHQDELRFVSDGSSLFWDAPGLDTISISAGTLDPPTGLRIDGQMYVADASDYYEVDE
jgi:hypothetical protein